MLGLRRPPRSHRRPGPRPKGRKPGAVVACGRLRLLSLAWLLATLGLAWAGHRLLARRFHGAHPQQQHRAGGGAAPQVGSACLPTLLPTPIIGRRLCAREDAPILAGALYHWPM